MWRWQLEWGRLSPELLIGSCPMRPADLDRILESTAASALLSVQHADCLDYWGIDAAAMQAAGEARGLRMHRVAMRDFDPADQRRVLPRAVTRLAALVDAGERVYLHCTAGLGRAPLTALAWLLWVQGEEEAAAWAALRRARPGAVPSPEALQGARADLVARHRGEIARRAQALHLGGAGGGPLDHWLQAETETLRAALRAPPADGDIYTQG